MNKVILTVFFLNIFLASLLGQNEHFLTPQEKAYIYHTVRKSPILEHNIGRYIIYSGKEIKQSNGEINYDSTEQVIINQPELLKIYVHEIRRSPKGILAELSNKVAIWELNSLLYNHRRNSLDKETNLSDYELYENTLLKHLPEKAKQIKKGEVQLNRKVEKLSNPTLTFKDKVAILDGFSNWTEEEKKETILAYNKTVNEWISQRAFQIYQKLGGEADYFLNILTAAGDGSSTSGLFEEREKDELGRWNKGLPRAVGLFPYEPYIGKNPIHKKSRNEVLPMPYTIHQFETVGNGRETNIHLDIWGYNSEKQTTAVIQKSGKYYPLFGSFDSRFLSPDSSFGGGTTYYSLIHKVKKDISDLEEKINGKKGLNYWIEYYERILEKRKLEYKKTEKMLSDMSRNQFITNGKKVKVDKKRSPVSNNPNSVTVLKTESGRKERKKEQDRLVYLFGEIGTIEKNIKLLKEEKKNVLFNQQNLNIKLQEMYDLIGTKWVPFKEKDGLYVYSDSTRFDLLTQEFTFPASKKKETVEVKLIAIPISHKSSQADEVMMHISVTDAVPQYNSQVQLKFQDLFESNKYQLSNKNFLTPKDSVAILEFFEALLNLKQDFEIIARGGGVGKWKNNRVVVNYEPKELTHYPGETDIERQKSKQDSIFARLRVTELVININRKTVLEVNSFTDPIQSNFKPSNQKMLNFMQQNNLSGNQLLSAYRTYTALSNLKVELSILAGNYLSPKEASKVTDKINRAIDKSRISVGKTSVKFKAFP